MKIVKVLYQYRRDFKAIFECENCGSRLNCVVMMIGIFTTMSFRI